MTSNPLEHRLQAAEVLRLPADPAERALVVTAGLLWLTLDGERWDHWLQPGETLPLPAGHAALLQAWPTASFQLRIALRSAARQQRRLCWPLSNRQLSLQPSSSL